MIVVRPRSGLRWHLFFNQASVLASTPSRFMIESRASKNGEVTYRAFDRGEEVFVGHTLGVAKAFCAALANEDRADSCALMEQLLGLGAALKTAGDEEEE